jgi:hypothetical protein
LVVTAFGHTFNTGIAVRRLEDDQPTRARPFALKAVAIS